MNVLRPQLVAVVAVLWFCGGGIPVLAQGVPSRGSRTIQISDPKVGAIVSNLNSAATSGKTSLRSLDDQFKAPFNFLDAADTAGGANLHMPMLRPPALSTKAAKQILDKKNEQEQWIFGSPGELEAQRLSAERMFGVNEYDENGAELTQKTPFQRYWEREDRERFAQTNRTETEFSGDKTDQDIKEQARAMFGVGNLLADSAAESQATAAKTATAPGSTSSFQPEASPLGSASELFAPPAMTTAPQKNEAAISRMNEFKQLFEGKSTGAGSGSSLGISPASVFSRPVGISELGTAPATTWRPATISPVSTFGSLPGSSLSRPLGGSPAPAFNLNPTPPPVYQAPRPTAQPAGFQLPKRGF